MDKRPDPRSLLAERNRASDRHRKDEIRKQRQGDHKSPAAIAAKFPRTQYFESKTPGKSGFCVYTTTGGDKYRAWNLRPGRWATAKMRDAGGNYVYENRASHASLAAALEWLQALE